MVYGFVSDILDPSYNFCRIYKSGLLPGIKSNPILWKDGIAGSLYKMAAATGYPVDIYDQLLYS